MTINATATILLALYVAAAEAGVSPVAGALRDDAERHPQGVRRPGDVHLPPPAVCAWSRTASPTALRPSPAGTPSASAATTSEKPAALPPGAGLHLRQRHRLRRAGAPPAWTWTPSPPASHSSSPAITTSSRRSPSSAPPGASGPGSSRSASGPATPIPAPALPRPDGGSHPHRPAARQQRGAGGPAGPRRRARRLPEPAQERPGRGAGAAHRSLGRAGPADAAGHRLRVGGGGQRRPAGRLLCRGSRDPRPGGRSFGSSRPHRDPGGALAAIERGEIQREIEDSAYRFQRELEAGSGRRRREPVPGGGRRRARRAAAHRPRPRAGAGRAPACRCAPGGIRRPGGAPWTPWRRGREARRT